MQKFVAHLLETTELKQRCYLGFWEHIGMLTATITEQCVGKLYTKDVSKQIWYPLHKRVLCLSGIYLEMGGEHSSA